MASISADEKRWRAESDARALAEANIIQSDSARLKAAQAAAKRMAAEQMKHASAIQKVAKNETNGTKKSTGKSPTKARISRAAPKKSTAKPRASKSTTRKKK